MGDPLPEVAGANLKRFVYSRLAEIGMVSESTGKPSVSALARASDVTRDTFQQWFRGRYPSPAKGRKAAAALGTTYAELVEARQGNIVSGTESPAGIVTEPAGLSELTKAINRLADVLSGDFSDLGPVIDEGIARARSRDRAGQRQRGRSPRPSPSAK